jgi:hypothetical protein
MARVYLPTTLPALAACHPSGAVVGHERITAADESEDAEYDALQAAAEAAEQLLDGPGRRVVLVGEGSTSPAGPIPFERIVAVHVDTADIVPGAEDLPELAWFATQEIPDLLAGAGV